MKQGIGQRDQPRTRFDNHSGESIPPYAVLRIDDTDAAKKHALKAYKPNGTTGNCTFALNLNRQVAHNSEDPKHAGTCTNAYGAWALYDDANTPQPGEEWGPDSDWLLHKGKGGYIIVGGAESFTVGMTTYNRVRVKPSGGSSGNIIYAQVNKVTNVGTGEPNFPFDNAQPVVGAAPSGGTGTAQNQYAQEYLNDEWVFLFENKLTGQWLTERGGSSGSQIVHFELTENKIYGDASALALPVLPNGDIDDEADEFYVVDELNQFFGRGPEDNDGYRGFALRFSDDYSEGIPGFRIITMEGPAQWLIVTLNEAASSTTTCLFDGVNQPWGRPFRGRRLPPTGTVEVHDDLSVASGAQSGDKWLAAWDEADEYYIFIVPIRSDQPMIPAVAMITENCPAMDDADLDGSAKTAFPGVSSDTAATIMKWRRNLPPKLEEHPDYEDPMAVLNLTETELTASTSKAILKLGYIQKFHDPDAESEEEETVYMFVYAGPRDIRELGGFDKPTKQIPYHDEDSANEILDGEDCPEE